MEDDEINIDIDEDDHIPLLDTNVSSVSLEISPSAKAKTVRTPVTSMSDADPEESELQNDEPYAFPDWFSEAQPMAPEDIDTLNMDDKSRVLIEQMLAEEEFYLGGRTNVYTKNNSKAQTSSSSRRGNGPKRKVKENNIPKQRRSSQSSEGSTRVGATSSSKERSKLSSADLPSHNTRWTIEEDERLKEGLRIHGYGQWKRISRVVATRNPLQCKNHARHLLISDKIDDTEGIEGRRRSISRDSSVSSRGRKRSWGNIRGGSESGDESRGMVSSESAIEDGETEGEGGGEIRGRRAGKARRRASRSASGSSGSGIGASWEDEEEHAKGEGVEEERDEEDTDVDIDIDDDDERVNMTHWGGSISPDRVYETLVGTTSPRLMPAPLTKIDINRTIENKSLSEPTKLELQSALGASQDTSQGEDRRRGRTVSFGVVRTRVIRDDGDDEEDQEEEEVTGGQAKVDVGSVSECEYETNSNIGNDYEYKVHRNTEELPSRGEPLTREFSTNMETSSTTSTTPSSDIPSTTPETDGVSVEDEDDSLRPPPIADFELDLSTIHPHEMRDNPEWFIQKLPKTPERYKKIRNYIIAAWNRCRPRYLTKTSVRSGLKDCGDVNAIGRVHTYLEMINAINIGCVNAPPKPKRSAGKKKLDEGPGSEKDDESEGEGLLPVWITEYEGPRKRRVRNEHGDWVDPRDLEGRVIAHDADGEDDESRPKLTKEEMQEMYEQERLAAQNARYFAPEEMQKYLNSRVPKNKRASYYLQKNKAQIGHNHNNVTGYDPFVLVPLQHYSPSSNPSPFIVSMVSDVLVVIDFHAHLAHTEIIGLLGGTLNLEKRILYVAEAFPCRSLSTGIQCEMDPDSEIRAREVFAQKGLNTVGWYHSHPTFESNPSVRDIENQTQYQSLFRLESGIEPFIGVIVSPYNLDQPSNQSRFHYISIGDKWDPSHSYRLPYACEREIARSDRIPPEIFTQFSELVREYRSYEHRVDLTEIYRKGETETRLDKLLDSLHANLYVDEESARIFLNKVRQLLTLGFTAPKSVAKQVENGESSSSAQSSKKDAIRIEENNDS